MLSSRSSGSAATGPTLSKVSPCPACTSSPSPRRRWPSPPAAPARAPALRRRPPDPPRNRPRCAARSPARRSGCAASICRRSAAMKSETRQPASRSGAMKCASRFSSCATSSPPSVVRSSRRSGTMQTACGRWRSAIACISSVAAISRFSGSVSSAISAAMSASVMCRRSSRRCAVIPSAPGRLGQLRRAQRLGIGPAAGVANRRHVVDVDPEPQWVAPRTARHVPASLSVGTRASG